MQDINIADVPKIRRDSIKALRHAWPHRHTLRGRIIVDANVKMLRRIGTKAA